MRDSWLAHYPPGLGRTIDTSAYASVVGLLEHACREYRDRSAFSSMDRTLTFAAVERHSRSFAAYLQQRLQMRPGERFAIMLPNCLQYVVALFGALRAGLVVVTINPLYTARELEHQLTDADAKALLVMENFAATLAKIEDNVPLETVMITQLGDMLATPRRVLVNVMARKTAKPAHARALDNVVAYRQALAAGATLAFDPVAVGPQDLALLQYTGGTTGPSKGAMLTHGNLVANVLQCQAWFRPELAAHGELVITALPMHHIFALTVNTLVYFFIGGHGVLIANPRDLPSLVKTLGRYPFSAITGVNTLYNALLNTPGFAELDFSTLKFCMAGAMATQRAVTERWLAVTGRPIIEGYGLSETSPVVTCNALDIERATHSIGVPLPSTDIDIRDDNDRPVPTGEPGELCVRGPQLMRGYWRCETASAAAFTADGYLRTGDIARQDDAGLIHIVDRKKDMIVVSGFNVFPSEIEDVVADHDEVLEAAAIGVPDERSGEAVKLFVVRRRSDLKMADIRAFCREHLTAYKVPKHYEFIDEVPKSNVGKILRRQLR